MTPSRPNLPRKARLYGGAQFTGKFSAKLQGKYFVVLFRENLGVEAARLGVVASKRAVPRAVVRSLMKRIVREVFRHARRNLGAVDVVVRIRQPAGRKNLPEVRRELGNLLSESCRCAEHS